MKVFNRYKAFMKTGILNVFAYKFNVFSWLLVSASSLMCLFFLWAAVFHNSPADIINGFTFKEIVSYTVIINIFGFVMGGGETQDVITDEIQNGQIAMSLIKPISYRLRFTFSTLGSLIASNMIVGFPLLIVSTIILTVNGYMEIKSPAQFVLNLLFFLIAQIFAKLLYDVIDYIFGLVSFYTMASFGLFQIKEVVINFLSGMMIPIAFFPEWAEKLVNYLPFVGMAQNPTLIYLGRMEIGEAVMALAMQLVWIVLLETFAHFFYLKAIKIVTIQGG
ncbi:MAG: ABC-2 family transporter protein [Lachnospiraceae bacterium]|nr:ABC-2 family transporter protein [Lachnospiraceae bacterium]